MPGSSFQLPASSVQLPSSSFHIPFQLPMFQTSRLQTSRRSSVPGSRVPGPKPPASSLQTSRSYVLTLHACTLHPAPAPLLALRHERARVVHRGPAQRAAGRLHERGALRPGMRRPGASSQNANKKSGLGPVKWGMDGQGDRGTGGQGERRWDWPTNSKKPDKESKRALCGEVGGRGSEACVNKRKRSRSRNDPLKEITKSRVQGPGSRVQSPEGQQAARKLQNHCRENTEGYDRGKGCTESGIWGLGSGT